MIDVKAKFVAVNTYGIDPSDLSGMVREVRLIAERRAPLMSGFLESVIMANQEHTRLVIVSLWESQHAWSAAQWDQEVGRVVSDMAESAQSFDVHTYEPISVVRSGVDVQP